MYLGRYYNSISKPIKSSHKTILASPPLRLETSNLERWAKSDKEKTISIHDNLADVLQPHEQETDEEMLHQPKQLNP